MFSTLCVKQGGKLVPVDREGMNRYVADLGDGEEVSLSLEPPHIGRSRQMEKFFHGPILKATMGLFGYNKQEAKDYLCLKFIPRDLVLPDGSIVRVPGSTSVLARADYLDLIDASIRHLAEGDVYIEDADEWKRKHGRAA